MRQAEGTVSLIGSEASKLPKRIRTAITNGPHCYDREEVLRQIERIEIDLMVEWCVGIRGRLLLRSVNHGHETPLLRRIQGPMLT